MRSTECPSSRFKTEDVDFILSFLFPFLLFILYVIVSCYILYFLCVECAAAVLNRVCNIILEYRTRTCCQYVFQRFFFAARCYASATYAVMRCPSVRPSVCLSRSCILSKRRKISSKCFHRRVATTYLAERTAEMETTVRYGYAASIGS